MALISYPRQVSEFLNRINTAEENCSFVLSETASYNHPAFSGETRLDFVVFYCEKDDAGEIHYFSRYLTFIHDRLVYADKDEFTRTFLRVIVENDS